jgi:hypothetical protein
MLIVFSIFSFLFFAKTALLSYFFSNYLIFLLYPLEISGLSLLNSNETIDDELILNLNTYLRWTTINWIGIDEDYKIFEQLENETPNNYTILLSWLLTFTLYQFYYLIYSKIKKIRLNKFNWIRFNLKYLIINYFSFFTWNLFILFKIDNMNFWIALVNILIFNFVTFWFPSLIFYFIYGDELFFYRNTFSFLIESFNIKYKYYGIILLSLKSLCGFYLLFYNYMPVESKYLLFFFNFLYLFLMNKYRVFKQHKNDFNVITLISIIINILSIVENYYPITLAFIITKYILVGLYISIVIFYCRNFRKEDDINQDLIEMDVVE